MHLSRPISPARARRLLAASAAATALVLGPTACDYGGVPSAPIGDTGQGDTGGHSGHHHDANVIVPVANTAENKTENDDRAGDRNRGRRQGQGRNAGGDSAAAAASGGPQKINGLDVLARDCSQSEQPPHKGFQESPACVSTAMGEVARKPPTLLITEAPQTVRAGDTFTLAVSTRGLKRDRFLPAGQGGYYLESSLLDDQGVQRGHFHTACRLLPSTKEAPDPEPVPVFFKATEDGQGGAGSDTVRIEVTGITEPGDLQCASWAGDDSHRIPMTTRANQIPAFDSVRIKVLPKDASVSENGQAPTATAPERDDETRAGRDAAEQAGGRDPGRRDDAAGADDRGGRADDQAGRADDQAGRADDREPGDN